MTILGAGTTIGNGDDFDWMDSRDVYSKNWDHRGRNAPKLRGDALLVSKIEAEARLSIGTANATSRCSRVTRAIAG
jgi:hypothetical protein